MRGNSLHVLDDIVRCCGSTCCRFARRIGYDEGMFNYSTRTLLVIVIIAALFCFLVFQVRPVHRVPILFALALVMPAPLAVILRHGSIHAASFAIGSLVAYAAWLLTCGLPCASMIAYEFIVRDSVQEAHSFKWMMEVTISKGYAGYVGLYAPWIVVPLGGLAGLLAHVYCVQPMKNSQKLD